MADAEQTLSDDFQVCLKIYDYNQRNEKVWFGILAKDMADINKSTQ